MQASKCDVCGTLFSEEYTPDITVQKYTHGYGEERLDLCPECQRKLEEFLHTQQQKIDDMYAGAAIVFAPMCSNCKNVIPGKVDSVLTPLINETFHKPYSFNYTPERCPHCGAIIRKLIMPAQLPQNSEDLFEYAETQLKE